MKLESIKILDFRNYERLEISRFGRTNFLIGQNGTGKTNFLEAVSVLLSDTPLRQVAHHELVRWSETAYYIGGRSDGDLYECGFSPLKKVLKKNHEILTTAAYSRKSSLLTLMPDDLSIVTGTPEERRNFLDRVLSGLDSDYRENRERYQKTLRQRNAQLKLAPRQASIWNHELIQSGCHLIEKRLKLCQYLSKKLKSDYAAFFPEAVELRYLNPFRIENSLSESFQKAIEASLPVDQDRGSTQIGPHRDQIEVHSGPRTAKLFASQGQRRLLAILLKLGMAELYEEKWGSAPIILADDVFLELDAERRKELLGRILPRYQTFLTLTGMQENLAGEDSLRLDVAGNQISVKVL